jgi:hypothetical protein
MSAPAVEQALQQLVSSGGTGNRLVLSRGPAYFHCTAGNGDKSILVEAAPSSALPKARALSPVRVSKLRAAGFASRPGHKCLGRHVALDDQTTTSTLSRQLLALFDSVYGEPGPEVGIESHSGDSESTTNPRLLDAMRQMAKKRDHRFRVDLYRALLDSTLLLLVQPDGDGTPAKVDELMKFEVYACFTSWDALRRYQPRGAPYEAVRGRHLFGRLLAHPVGSLLIDPKSGVGGELYRNELETLAGASYGARRSNLNK